MRQESPEQHHFLVHVSRLGSPQACLPISASVVMGRTSQSLPDSDSTVTRLSLSCSQCCTVRFHFCASLTPATQCVHRDFRAIVSVVCRHWCEAGTQQLRVQTHTATGTATQGEGAEDTKDTHTQMLLLARLSGTLSIALLEKCSLNRILA